MRIHKIICEALQRLRWREFEVTLTEDVDLQNVKTAILQLRASVKMTQLERLESLPSFPKLFDRFRTFWQNGNGPISLFWSSYIDLATLLLAFIRATREGNWQLHLYCVQTMIPYMFAYDRNNYRLVLSPPSRSHAFKSMSLHVDDHVLLAAKARRTGNILE